MMRRRAEPKRILFIVGRDNWIKSAYMNGMFVRGLRKLGFVIMWEDPSFAWSLRLQRMGRYFPRLAGRTLGVQMRLIDLLCGMTHRDYPRFRERLKTDLQFRVENLRKRLGLIRGRKEVSILCYSSGARVSSLAADSLAIKKLICIGYPFRNPSEGENPDRYRHLAGLKTPMLIVQGNQDEYGGYEFSRTLPLSPAIELFPVDSTHAYDLDAGQWEAIQAKIGSALAPQA